MNICKAYWNNEYEYSELPTDTGKSIKNSLRITNLDTDIVCYQKLYVQNLSNYLGTLS